MTGPEHYLEAERILQEAKTEARASDPALAQVHAILALTAAVAMQDHPNERNSWIQAAGVRP
jgi:hypothetical protein